MNVKIFEDEKVKKLLKQNSVSKLSLFGSVGKNEDNEQSDIDFIIKFSKSIGLLTIIKVERELEKILGRKVDLVTENSISPYLRKDIFNESKIVYEEK